MLIDVPDLVLPPKKLVDWVGDGDFLKIGSIFMELLINYGELLPSNSILDLGCGSGRVAIPLTKYLNFQTQYAGVDVSKECIEYCNSAIHSVFSNFSFNHLNIFNKKYNPSGILKDVLLPFPNESFQFVFAASLFTHLLPKHSEEYFAEINRVLKSGGVFLATYFIYCDLTSKPRLNFNCDFGSYRVADANVPEGAVAYSKDYISALYRQNGFEVIKPIRYGTWRKRKQSDEFQDMIVVKKIGVPK